MSPALQAPQRRGVTSLSSLSRAQVTWVICLWGMLPSSTGLQRRPDTVYLCLRLSLCPALTNSCSPTMASNNTKSSTLLELRHFNYGRRRQGLRGTNAKATKNGTCGSCMPRSRPCIAPYFINSGLLQPGLLTQTALNLCGDGEGFSQSLHNCPFHAQHRVTTACPAQLVGEHCKVAPVLKNISSELSLLVTALGLGIAEK